MSSSFTSQLTQRLLLLFVLSVPISLFAQEDKGVMKKGLKEYYEGNVRKSLSYFEAEALKDEKNVKAKYFQARCLLEMHDKQPKKALEILESLETSNIKSVDRGYYYFLAMAYHQNEMFEEALTAIKEIEGDSPRPEDEIRLLKENITLAQKHYANPNQGLVVKNLGPLINSQNMEYSAVMMDDYRTILYTARQPEDGSASMAEDGYTFEKIFKTSLDDNDEWTTPKEITDGTRPKHHDASVQMLYDENKLVVFRNGGLFLTDYVEGQWSKGEKVIPITSIAYQAHCFIADGGRTIYFSSDLASENGDLDLYVTYKQQDGKWGEPIPIDALNTPYDEDSPFLAEDGSFYFSSKGHGSMGGYDVFRSAYNPGNKTWAKPENLGYPTNSVMEDVFYNIEGKYAYYSSSRSDGFGSLDVYGIYLFDRIKLSGKIIDLEKKEAIKNANITMVHEDNVYQTESDENGAYEIVVPFEKPLDVTINQETKNIFNDKVTIDIFFAGKNAQYDFIIGGNTASTSQSKTGKIKFFSKNTLDSENLISSLETPDTYLVKPQELIASNANDEEVATGNNTNGEANPEIAANTTNEAGDAAQTVPAEMIAESSIPKFESFQLLFAFDKAIISSPDYNSLEKLITFLDKYPSKKVSITGHTDSTGDANYNKYLSERRAKAAASYLEKKGIDRTRINTIGKGEENPLVPNTSKENRSKNRRAEVVIE